MVASSAYFWIFLLFGAGKPRLWIGNLVFSVFVSRGRNSFFPELRRKKRVEETKCLLAEWSTTYNFPKKKGREKAIQKNSNEQGKTFDFPSAVTKNNFADVFPSSVFQWLDFSIVLSFLSILGGGK